MVRLFSSFRKAEFFSKSSPKSLFLFLFRMPHPPSLELRSFNLKISATYAQVSPFLPYSVSALLLPSTLNNSLVFPHPHLCPVPPPNSFFPNPLPPLFISFNFAFLSSWGRRYAFSLSLYLCPLISLTLWMSFIYRSLSECLSSISHSRCVFLSLFLSLSTFVLSKHTPLFFFT